MSSDEGVGNALDRLRADLVRELRELRSELIRIVEAIQDAAPRGGAGR